MASRTSLAGSAAIGQVAYALALDPIISTRHKVLKFFFCQDQDQYQDFFSQDQNQHHDFFKAKTLFLILEAHRDQDQDFFQQQDQTIFSLLCASTTTALETKTSVFSQCSASPRGLVGSISVMV